MGIVLVLSTVVLAQIFLDEEAAINFRNNFVDYPEIIGQAEITRISARLDDENVIFEWKLTIIIKEKEQINKLLEDFKSRRQTKTTHF